jgi:hypothetical protein
LIENVKKVWGRIGYWVGYALFFVSVAYSVYQAPAMIWNLDLGWLGVVIGLILAMFVIELLQFFIFLQKHQIKIDYLIPIRFTTRKSILNAVLPAKTGTLLFLHLITDHYKLSWHEYVQFMITSSVVLLFVSGLAFLGLVLPPVYFVIILLISLIGAYLLGRFVKWGYLGQTLPLFLVSIAVYVSRLLIFWALLQSSGNSVGFTEASYFAIATNTLAQVAITPGNIGIREVLFGLMAPYLSLPMEVGVIIGALFQVLRIIVYGIILVGVDFSLRGRLDELTIETAVSDQLKNP